MNESLPQDPYALLQVVSAQLDPEAQEAIRRLIATRQQQRLNRGVVVTGPSAIDDIDPTNQAMAILMHEHPGVLYNFGINASSFGGFSEDKSKFVIVASDLLVQHRRHIIEIILHDYLGNRPATSLAGPDLAPGLFLFSGGKMFPHELSEKNAKKLVDYFEETGNNREVWTHLYWKFADERSRQVEHWLPPE